MNKNKYECKVVKIEEIVKQKEVEQIHGGEYCECYDSNNSVWYRGQQPSYNTCQSKCCTGRGNNYGFQYINSHQWCPGN